MKINLKDGSITFDVFELLEHAPVEKLLELADNLAITNKVIEYVTQQILDGWTDHNSQGGTGYPARSNPTSGLEWAWREVAKRSGETAESEISRLETALQYKTEKIVELEKELRILTNRKEKEYLI